MISGNQYGDVSCHGGNNGWAEFTVAQGTAPYSYSWNDTLHQTNAKALNLPAGVYTVVVLDANGCQLIDSLQISEPDSSIAVQVTMVPVSCFGASNGSIDVTVSGGISPYTLSWSNGMLGNQLLGLSAGALTLSITDAIGCTFDTLIVISQPQLLVAEAEIINPIMSMGGSATVMVTATGGTEPYKGIGEYFVSPGYQTFYVSDTNGCTANVSINVPDAGKILTGDTSACLGDHLSIPIYVFGFKDIASFKMNMGYNTSLLHCTGFRNVDPSIYSGVEIYHDSIQGEISILWHDATPVTIADSGQVIELIFKTLAQGKSGLIFNDSAGMNVFYNVYNQEIPVQFNSGNAKIIVPAVVEIIGNKTLDFGDPLELMAMVWTGNPMTYQWITPSDNTASGFSYKVEHVGETDQGDYIIKVLDRNGCLANDTVLVSVGSRQLARIEVPTGFSPNADGLNDDFMAYTNLDIPFEYKMLVYNKWGELIFESDNINNGWDGTYKGQPCQSDLYTWVVYFKVPGYIQILQESPIRGVVMLLR
ncbi:MAG: gliding motility-associated C-terminal domain-containing protein [Bacteroidales bacterium]|nr:gliding motility-associated C-terminal domain-containing protein [Bacteroidales bacterium]